MLLWAHPRTSSMLLCIVAVPPLCSEAVHRLCMDLPRQGQVPPHCLHSIPQPSSQQQTHTVGTPHLWILQDVTRAVNPGACLNSYSPRIHS